MVESQYGFEVGDNQGSHVYQVRDWWSINWGKESYKIVGVPSLNDYVEIWSVVVSFFEPVDPKSLFIVDFLYAS